MKIRVKRHTIIQPPDQSIRLIPLTQGQNAIVDSTNYEWLNQWNWTAKKRLDTFYARRYETQNGKRVTVYMHRLITGINSPETDHRNGNGLDNRRWNLLPCSRSRNQSNRRDSRVREPEIGSAWLLY